MCLRAVFFAFYWRVLHRDHTCHGLGNVNDCVCDHPNVQRVVNECVDAVDNRYEVMVIFADGHHCCSHSNETLNAVVVWLRANGLDSSLVRFYLMLVNCVWAVMGFLFDHDCVHCLDSKLVVAAEANEIWCDSLVNNDAVRTVVVAIETVYVSVEATNV